MINATDAIGFINDYLVCSAQNWSYAAKQFLIHFPRDVIVHCESEYLYGFLICLSYLVDQLNFGGADCKSF